MNLMLKILIRTNPVAMSSWNKAYSNKYPSNYYIIPILYTRHDCISVVLHAVRGLYLIHGDRHVERVSIFN
jgi:hypothetical protein